MATARRELVLGDKNLRLRFAHLDARLRAQEAYERCWIRRRERAADIERPKLTFLDDELTLVVAIEFFRHFGEWCSRKLQSLLRPSSGSGDIGAYRFKGFWRTCGCLFSCR